MRGILLGLVLLNALYWAWGHWIDVPPPVRNNNDATADLPTLQLVSEVEGTQTRLGSGALNELNLNDVEPLIVVDTGTAAVLDANSDVESTDEMADLVTATNLMTDGATPAAGSPASDAAAGGQTGTIADITIDTATDTTTDTASAEPLIASTVLARVDPIANPSRCESVGPFLSLRQASAAVTILNTAGVTTQQRVEEAEVWVGHWVHLPPYPTRAAAVAVVERLRREGVKDIYIESSGELKNSVSLGLFSDIEGAEIRAGKVRRLGVRPQIQDRRREGLVYWVDSAVEAGSSIDLGMFEALPHQTLRTAAITCAGRLNARE